MNWESHTRKHHSDGAWLVAITGDILRRIVPCLPMCLRLVWLDEAAVTSVAKVPRAVGRIERKCFGCGVTIRVVYGPLDSSGSSSNEEASPESEKECKHVEKCRARARHLAVAVGEQDERSRGFALRISPSTMRYSQLLGHADVVRKPGQLTTSARCLLLLSVIGAQLSLAHSPPSAYFDLRNRRTGTSI